MRETTDQLARRVEAGDVAARGQLVERLFPELWRQFEGRRFAGEDLESVLQSALASYWEDPGALVAENVEALGVLRRRVKDHLLERLRRARTLKRGGGGEHSPATRRQDWEFLAEPADDAAPPEVQVMAAESLQAMLDLLNETEQRVVYLLLDGCQWNEIGNQMGLSRAAVYRLRNKIKAKLAEP